MGARSYGDTDGYASGPPSDRLPPQDVGAEQSVLGGMLLSKDAIADVGEAVRGHDFYRPAHELIFDAVIDLYSRGEPADAITVADELSKRGDLQRAGGQAYLHDLIQSVPTAANAGYYAQIVAERAVLRRLVEAGTKIVQMGYAQGGGDVEDIVNQAQAEVYTVAEKRGGEDYAPLWDTLNETMTEIEVAAGRTDEMTGVPTGFTDLDELTHGLHPGQMVVIAARPAIGKALALDTPLPTPTGWTTMGEVAVGDQLIDAEGRATTVVAATEVMTDRPCYEVEFSDGSVIVADAQHQWQTTAAVRTTEQIAATLAERHEVAFAEALDLAGAAALEGAYTVGVAVGRECSGQAEVGPEVEMWVGADGDATALLHQMGQDEGGLAAVLRADRSTRRSVLAGLVDVAGSVDDAGRVVVDGVGGARQRDVTELVRGLGFRVDEVSGHAVVFSTDADIFRVEHLAIRHKELRGPVGPRVITDVRRIDSVPVRCVEVDNPSRLYLAGRSMIPTHNSTLGVDIARAAAIHHQMATAIFSLEMSRSEITMRVLAAEASIQLQHLRRGKMSDPDWRKLSRVVGRISDSPLYIDDSPNLALMEIRAKARRLKQQHNLKLIVIDYLQLMTSGKKVESRQQEVSEFSRALKLLAKELQVPVIAISQLNRGPEQRTDKRPAMSDLRESGCLPAETRILRADTGAETTIGELVETGAQDIDVWALDDSLRYVKRKMTHAFSTGTAVVFKLTLASGKTVRATENHPFLAYEGWTPLAQLRQGDRVAVPRHVPSPRALTEWEDARVILLAHMLGDGSFVKRQPLRYASIDEANLEVVTKSALAFGITTVRDDYAAARVSTLRLRSPFPAARGKRNPLAEWLDGLGLFGLRSHEKFLPDEIFSLPKAQIALFIKHIWATDGSVTVNKNGRGGRIYYASTSRRLVDDLGRLLLRFGIQTRLRTTHKDGYREGFTIDISGVDSQRRFLQEIGVFGARGANAERLLEIVRDVKANTNVDTIPKQVWEDVKDVMSDAGMTTRQFQAALGTEYCGSALYASAPSRERLTRVAQVLDSAELELMAVNDVFWDTVVAVEADGVEEVYDATVLGRHNFVANGIAVHNSIEQDADLVILLHRDRDPGSEREGEADVIVAKHRNGPTADIVLGFQGHYARFSNLAKDSGGF
ncbi:replicative DNA helicase [Janibacter hoylei]